MVNLTLSRSDTLYENHNIPADMLEATTLGPFEYVEFTYGMLRVDGTFIGSIRDDGAWHLNDDPHPFSDLVVSSS